MNWKRAALASVCIVPLVALFAWGFTRDPRDIKSPLPGRSAPTFQLPVFAPGQGALAKPIGDTIRLDQLRGKVVVVNFYASWCVACRDEHPVMSAVARRYTGRPVQFVGVLYDDTPDAARQWITDMGGESYPSVTDVASRTAINYGLYGVPETYFIDATGRVAYKQTGPATDAILTRIIDSLLATAPAAAAPSMSR